MPTAVARYCSAGGGFAALCGPLARVPIKMRAVAVRKPINVPIDNTPQEEKQAWLDTWLRERRAGHGVRYYAEPTFLFDE